MGLRTDDDGGVEEDALHEGRRGVTQVAATPGEEAEHLGQDLLGGDERRASQGLADRPGGGMPLIPVVEQGDPVIRVGEDPPHDRRFGAP